jgi:hypothetical protein
VIGTELISEVVEDYWQVSSTDPEYGPLREQVLRSVRKAAAKAYARWAWPGKRRASTITFTAATYEKAGLPSGVAVLGPNQGVFDTDQPWPLVYMEPREILELIRIRPRLDNARYYSITGQDPTTGLGVMAIYPGAQITKVLTFDYDAPCPIIADSGTDDGLVLFPDDVARTLIYDMTVLREMRNAGDLRSAGEMRAEIKETFEAMVKSFGVAHVQTDLPSYGEGLVW